MPASGLAADLRRASALFPVGIGGHDGAVWAELLRSKGEWTAVRRRVGALPAPPGAARHGAGPAARLQSWVGAAPWLATPQSRIPVIDADSGETVVLGAAAGIHPVTALRATCAVSGMLPEVPVAGRRCDDGAGTPTHADLAAGCDRVLVLAPFGESICGPVLDEELARLTGRARVVVIRADGAASAGFGADPFDGTGWPIAAAAGLAQGRAAAAQVRDLLSAPR